MEVGKALYRFEPKALACGARKKSREKGGIWLIYPRPHTGKRRVIYNDAVEEAFCFGWI